MSYYYNSSGALQYSHAYSRPTTTMRSSTSSAQVKADPIRPMSLYVHSNNEISNGHLARWEGTASMFHANGEQINNFSAQNGHEFALGQIESNDTVHSKEIAGVVIEKAAGPGDYAYKHKAIHSTHPMQNNTKYVHRLATSGAVVLAWVLLDDHENCLNGLYTEYLNGAETGKAVVRELGTDHFTIEKMISNETYEALQAQVDTLTQRIDSLTSV